MRQRNHCSSLKGIPKMKLQDSGPSGPKSLQSQNRPRPENRLSISRLDVVHGQLWTAICSNRIRASAARSSILGGAKTRQNAGADQRRQPRRRLPETARPIRGPFSGLGPLFPVSGETGGLAWALPLEILLAMARPLRCDGDHNLDRSSDCDGFNKQIFGADEQVRGRWPSD